MTTPSTVVVYNKRLFYLLCVEKLAPDHIKDSPPSQYIGLSIVLFKFSPAVVVLGLRQSPVYNQNLNCQLTFKSKLGKPIHVKKIIHLLNLKELHLEHILALSHAGISSGSIYIGRYKCLKNVKFRLSWK